MSHGKKNFLVWAGIGFLAACAVTVIVFIIWAANPMSASQQALAHLRSTETVNFGVHPNGWLVFEPKYQPKSSGLVWYPEARVDPKAYAALANRVANFGHLVVIVTMPLNLPFLNPDAARLVTQAFPQIKAWAVGGHGTGAAITAELVRNSARFAGLLLCGASPSQLLDLSKQAGILVHVIYGTNDTIALPEKIRLSKKRLPPNTRFVEIIGGNHAGVGYYGRQPGDSLAGISADRQQRLVAEAITVFLNTLDSQV